VGAAAVGDLVTRRVGALVAAGHCKLLQNDKPAMTAGTAEQDISVQRPEVELAAQWHAPPPLVLEEIQELQPELVLAPQLLAGHCTLLQATVFGVVQSLVHCCTPEARVDQWHAFPVVGC